MATIARDTNSNPYAGDNPATQQKIRQALQNEPELKQRAWWTSA